MKLDDAVKLHQKKYREASGHFLVEGEHLVRELQKAAAKNPALLDCVVYVTRVHAGWQGPFPLHEISDRQMGRLSETNTPQGIVAVVPLPMAPAPVDPESVLYLHEIQDPGNLGTILRTLAWFGAWRCLLSPGSVDPWNAKVVRASMGAVFHVPIEQQVSTSALRERHPRLACLALKGTPISDPAFGGFDCYVFGNEARGLPGGSLAGFDVTDFSIGGSGAIDSLNLAAAVNICVYELQR